MKLGMEIPTIHAEEISRITDFDFAIAHRIVEDHAYQQFFLRQREKGRFIILDNGFHERGHNAKREDVVMAQAMIHADVVISPDRIDDVSFTRDNLEWSLSQFNMRTAAVIVGDTVEDRLSLLDLYSKLYVTTLCFPYRRDRQAWIAEFDVLKPGWDLGKSIHFLGMQTLSEARIAATRFPKGTFDTSKPLKWGYKLRHLDELRETHGGWPDYDSFLDAPAMEMDQYLVSLFNVCLLRRMIA